MITPKAESALFHNLLQNPPRYLFFTGKGGVGKTTTATATAIALADSGQRVLLVSTDPASNLDEVLGVALSAEPVPVPGVLGLFALNIDPVLAAAAYREKLVGPYRGILPDAAIRSMEEQLSGACTVEIAAFNEFATLMGNPTAGERFDHIIFDTAPTGHTLRLLSLPAAWSDFIDTNTGGTSCLGPLAGLKAHQLLYTNTRRSLGDAAETLVVVVSRPDVAPLAEAARASAELQELGVANQYLVINGVLQLTDPRDTVAVALREKNMKAMATMPKSLTLLPRTELPLRGTELVGIPSLRAFFSPENTLPSTANPAPSVSLPAPLGHLLDMLEAMPAGVIMTMGKGGVGKTTLAVNIATALVARGKKVHLTTTDPAAHVALTLGTAPEGMQVSRVDPEAETEAYRIEVLATVGASLDDEARALLEEDLRSPCTEEIAVFRAFAKIVAQGTDRFVVIDTAPTGHTLLLLDASESYHREVSRSMSDIPEAVRQLLPRLKDPEFTKVFLVTLPEATPVHEAQALQADLRRAGIEPAGWIINQSLAPLAVTDPILAQRRAREFRYIDEVVRQGLPTFLVPWQTEPIKKLTITVVMNSTTKPPKGERQMKIEIYDPAMCCSTGVCGPSVDPELVRIQEVLRQIQKQAPTVQVQRSGLTSDPQAFVANSTVTDLLKNEGPECLPLVFVDGELIGKGSYPGNQQVQETLRRAGFELALTENKKNSCGCGPGCC